MPIPTHVVPNAPSPNAKSRAAETIFQWIIEGVLVDGEKIRDQDIAQSLGVSRMPVREAFQILEAIGFIETTPNRATRVSPLQQKDIVPLYKTIARLEALGLETTMDPVRPETIEELYTLNHRFQQALDQKDVRAILERDQAFHNRLVAGDGNRFCQQALSPLKMTAARYEHRYFSELQPLGTNSSTEHRMILEALVQHNIPRAQEILTQNWLRTADALQARYAN